MEEKDEPEALIPSSQPAYSSEQTTFYKLKKADKILLV
jgi:hypothetical protein